MSDSIGRKLFSELRLVHFTQGDEYFTMQTVTFSPCIDLRNQKVVAIWLKVVRDIAPRTQSHLVNLSDGIN